MIMTVDYSSRFLCRVTRSWPGVICFLAVLFLAVAPRVSLGVILGDARVLSSVNQPLLAQIEILDTEGVDLEEISATIPPREAFVWANVEYQDLLDDLSVGVIPGDGVNNPYIELSTSSVVRDLLLGLLLDVEWPDGQVMREYSLLLDFGDVAQASGVTRVDSQPGSDAETDDVGTLFEVADLDTSEDSEDVFLDDDASLADDAFLDEAADLDDGASLDDDASLDDFVVVQPATRRLTDRQTVKVLAGSRAPRTYRVGKDQGLWEIARTVRPNPSVNVYQTMAALYRNNTSAFINRNINRLRSGYTLVIPDLADIESVPVRQASQFVANQNSDWLESAGNISDQRRLKILSVDGRKGKDPTVSIKEAVEKRIAEELSSMRELVDSLRQENSDAIERLIELEGQLRSFAELDAVNNEKIVSLEQSLQESRELIAMYQGSPLKAILSSTSGIILFVVVALIILGLVVALVSVIIRRRRSIGS